MLGIYSEQYLLGVLQVYMDTAEKDGISLEEPCHAVREFQITALVRGTLGT